MPGVQKYLMCIHVVYPSSNILIISATQEGHEGLWTTFDHVTPLDLDAVDLIPRDVDMQENCGMIIPMQAFLYSLTDYSCTSTVFGHQHTICETGLSVNLSVIIFI